LREEREFAIVLPLEIPVDDRFGCCRMELVDAQALVALIEAGTAPAIVDVRSRWEFERGHVPGARWLPFWKIGSHLHEMTASRSDPVVVYCGHGPRAQWAAAVLRRRGFAHVILLEGHWARWLREARPQERPPSSRRSSIDSSESP